jgi:hypothetical protein
MNLKECREGHQKFKFIYPIRTGRVRHLLEFRVVLEALVNDRDELAGEQPEDPDPPVLSYGGEHHVTFIRTCTGTCWSSV